MWKYLLESSLYKIEITGGSVRIIDKYTNSLRKEFKGYTYLYTGALHPNEIEFFALENGKHFYVYSLENLELKQRITLPRGYDSIDVCGFYSEDVPMLVERATALGLSLEKRASRNNWTMLLFRKA